MTNRFIEKLQRHVPLGQDDIAALIAVTTTPRTILARRDLIRDGDRPGPMFVMIDGWACRYKILPAGTRRVLSFLMPGDSCDLQAGVLAEMDHSIQTITSASVATIDRADLETIMADRPAVARALYVSQLVDDGTMRAWITSMGRRTSIERVAHLMCELYLKGNNIGVQAEPHFILPLSQLLLADALGMTPVHLNRVLKELRLSGAMTPRRGAMVITDPAQLVRIAGFDENYLHRRMRKAA